MRHQAAEKRKWQAAMLLQVHVEALRKLARLAAAPALQREVASLAEALGQQWAVAHIQLAGSYLWQAARRRC